MPSKTNSPIPFPLSRILTVTPGEYFDSVRKDPKDYKLSGVHYVGRTQNLALEFSKNVPCDSEIVVGYRIHILENGETYFARHSAYTQEIYRPEKVAVIGVALIPRKKNSRKK